MITTNNSKSSQVWKFNNFLFKQHYGANDVEMRLSPICGGGI